MRRIGHILITVVLAGVAASPGASANEALARQVLQEKCSGCHGAEKQKGSLRLDALGALMRGSSGGPVIAPGDPATSKLLTAIQYTDEKLQMPPDGKLSDAEIVAIETWIRDGANWDGVTPAAAVAQAESEERERVLSDERYWAFRPVTRPELPANVDATWVRNPIDAFVCATLDERGIAPSPEADRRALVRRVYLDVLGLPPSPEEVAAFIADPSPTAYDALVDRVLASPHYGERWARHWLDVVRFAETNGYETNTPRKNAWPYRDYVIGALNADKPYDRFILEQLAGDSFGEDVATGFLVGGTTDEVKSPDVVLTKNQRDSDLHDMVSTSSSAFLGLTVGCAKCHDHKFDPISRRDYYSMRACFEGVKHGERPVMLREDDPRAIAIAPIKQAMANVETTLLRYVAAADTETRFVDNNGPLSADPGMARADMATMAKRRDGLPENPKLNALAGNGKRIPVLAGEDAFSWQPAVTGLHDVWVSWQCGDDSLSHDARYALDMDGDLATKEDRLFLASLDQQLRADGTAVLPGKAVWSGFKFVGAHVFAPTSCVVLTGSGLGDCVVNADVIAVRPSQHVANVAQPSYAVNAPGLRMAVEPETNTERFAPVDARFVRFVILDAAIEPCIDEFEIFSADDPSKNIALATNGAVATASSVFPGNELHRIEHLNDGQYGNSRSWIPHQTVNAWAQIELPQTTRIDRVTWSRDREGRFRDRLPKRYRIEVATEPDQWTVVASSGDRLPIGENDPGITQFSQSPDDVAAMQKLDDERRALLEQLKAVWPYPDRTYAGVFEKPGPTFLLRRGDPMQEEGEVTPAGLRMVTPALTIDPTEPEQQRRLKLAQWIANPNNPLTARVMVNRIWKHHFGRGLVDTPGDLGAMGGKPTHPALLDWLASEFVAQGWSMKSMHRLILLSNTYRQSSTPRAEAMAVDADTRLLWRFPARRIEAEPIRDSILAVSGKLDLTMGGPGYDPFRPDESYVHIYIPKDTFESGDFRRMIYQWKPRREQDFTFGVFDCPDASQVTPKRVISTSPLQALSLMNSPFCVQQSEFFAERVEREAGEDVGAQVTRAFQLALGRAPREDEMTKANALIAQYGLVHLCRALYNANEFVYLP